MERICDDVMQAYLSLQCILADYAGQSRVGDNTEPVHVVIAQMSVLVFLHCLFRQHI